MLVRKIKFQFRKWLENGQKGHFGAIKDVRRILETKWTIPILGCSADSSFIKLLIILPLVKNMAKIRCTPHIECWHRVHTHIDTDALVVLHTEQMKQLSNPAASPLSWWRRCMRINCLPERFKGRSYSLLKIPSSDNRNSYSRSGSYWPFTVRQ